MSAPNPAPARRRQRICPPSVRRVPVPVRCSGYREGKLDLARALGRHRHRGGGEAPARGRAGRGRRPAGPVDGAERLRAEAGDGVRGRGRALAPVGRGGGGAERGGVGMGREHLVCLVIDLCVRVRRGRRREGVSMGFGRRRDGRGTGRRRVGRGGGGEGARHRGTRRKEGGG